MNRLMRRIGILFFVFLFSIDILSSETGTPEIVPLSILETRDSIEIQILFNGRAWRNLYNKVKGDQFLFSNEFLTGSVSIDSRTFENLKIKYDIYNDEVILITDHGIIIQLNKEMIDLFSLEFNKTIYHFRNLDADSLDILSGYVNVLYEDSTSLYVKYRKEILQLAVENKYDLFNQVNKIFIKKNGEILKVDSKGEFLKLLNDQKHQLRNFIRSNKLKISRKYPESFVPVIEYYNKLSR